MKISVYVRKDRRNADGSYGIYLRFKPVNENRFMIHTGLTCMYEPVNFSFPKTEPNGRVKSVKLMEMYTKCEDFVYRNRNLTTERMKECLSEIITGKHICKNSVESMFNEFSSKKYKGTRKMYERTCKKVISFDPKADFDKIDKDWLNDFWKFLEDDGANVNGIGHHFRNLRAVFNYAIEQNVTNNYPFRKFKIKKEQTGKRDLTIEQLRVLRDYPLKPFQQPYRDVFMLMFYLCGINAGDLFLLTEKNIKNGRIEYYRQKTKKYYSIKIEPEAKVILDKYKGKNYLLSMMDNNIDYHQPLKRLNQQLKKIGMVYQDGKKWSGTALFPDLSSYYSRHTWASIASEIDIPMDVIAQALGHATPYSTTDIYVNRRLKKIDVANRKVLDYLLADDRHVDDSHQKD